MATLTDSERATVRVEVGSTPDDTTLDTIFERRRTVGGVIYDVLAERLATLIASPAQFTVPGEYSQSTAANIAALRDALHRWRAYAPSEAASSALTVSYLRSRHARTGGRRQRHGAAPDAEF